MTFIITIVHCLFLMLYITGVVYWYNSLKNDVNADIFEHQGCTLNMYLLILVVSMLWPVLVCYNAAKELGVLGKK